MYLLEQLLTPPAGTTLRSALPSGTYFNSVTVENGLCTVDVSEEFDSRRFYSMSAQSLSLLSIVGKDGATGKILLPLNEEEIKALHNSAECLKNIINNIEI